MASRILPVALLLLLVLGVGLYFGLRQEKTFVPDDVVNSYRAEFQMGQIQPGWVLRSVSRDPEKSTRILHRVQIPPPLAGDLLVKGHRERRQSVGPIACPSAEHDIWEKLTPRQDVEIELFTDRGTVTRISCRAAVL